MWVARSFLNCRSAAACMLKCMLGARSLPLAMRLALTMALAAVHSSAVAATGTLPDGRIVTPAGFTSPVEGFASAEALSPDGRWLAVLSQDGAALDLLAVERERLGLAARLPVRSATGLTWTADGLYVTCGYSGTIARYAYDAGASRTEPALTKRIDMQVDAAGLLNGIAEDPATHRLAVARSAVRSTRA